MKTLYLVLKLIHWDNIGTDSPLMQWPVSFSPVFGQAFMPVFESRYEAEKHYPDTPIQEMTWKPKEEAST